MPPNLRAEERNLQSVIERSNLSNALKDQLYKELRTAFVELATNRSSGISRLQSLAGRLPRDERDPFISFLEALLSSKGDAALSVQTSRYGIDVAVLCALRDPELERVLDLMTSVEEIQATSRGGIPSRTVYKGHLTPLRGTGYQPTIVAAHQARTGMVDAAILSAELLIRWRPHLLAMTGVCGGRASEGVRVGDLIVPTEIVLYGSGKHTDAGFEAEPQVISLEQGLAHRVSAAARSIAFQVSQEWPGPHRDAIQVHTAPLACGEAVVDKKGMLDEEIAKIHRKIAGVDMESFSVVRATQILADSETVPFVVKGVMDLTHRKQQEQDKEFAAFASARFLYHFVLSEAEWLIGSQQDTNDGRRT